MNDGRTAPETDDGGDRTLMCESTDNGRTWQNLRDWGNYGVMYPRVLRLRDGRLMATFTQRAIYYPIGLQAIFSYDDGQTWDFDSDRIVIEGKTPWGKPSGGGFGNTIQLDDETMISCYTYMGKDDQFHLEVVRWPLPKPRAITPFAKTFQVSSPQPPAGRLESLDYPRDLSALVTKIRVFADHRVDLHTELVNRDAGSVLMYFKTAIDCPEAMKLAACLGYDGPVKVWIDGKEIFHDPQGTNPMERDDAKVAFDADQGRHDILIAFAWDSTFWVNPNQPAWGICLRFERTDLTMEQLLEGAEAWHLPELIADLSETP